MVYNPSNASSKVSLSRETSRETSFSSLSTSEHSQDSAFRSSNTRSRGKKRRARQGPLCFAPLHSSAVSFGTVSIAEFPVEIGNNPGCSHGCPITMSSKASQHIENVPARTYEIQRLQHSSKSREDYRLSSGQREARLLKAGFTINEIHAATKVAFQDRLRRERSIHQIPFDGFNLLVEKTTRGFQKMLTIPPRRIALTKQVPNCIATRAG